MPAHESLSDGPLRVRGRGVKICVPLLFHDIGQCDGGNRGDVTQCNGALCVVKTGVAAGGELFGLSPREKHGTVTLMACLACGRAAWQR